MRSWQRAEEIWDSGRTASSPLSRPCRPKLLIIYHSALIGLSRVLRKQLPKSALGSNTGTDVHLGQRDRVVATFSIYSKGYVAVIRKYTGWTLDNMHDNKGESHDCKIRRRLLQCWHARPCSSFKRRQKLNVERKKHFTKISSG